jgi:hypothetical protein
VVADRKLIERLGRAGLRRPSRLLDGVFEVPTEFGSESGHESGEDHLVELIVSGDAGPNMGSELVEQEGIRITPELLQLQIAL